MTAEELEAALSRGAWVTPSTAPNPIRPVSEIVGVTDEHALVMARKFCLIDDQGFLHCGHCKQITDWHVGLHCPDCRASAPARQRERERLELDRRQAEPPPAERVVPRSFRDGY